MRRSTRVALSAVYLAALALALVFADLGTAATLGVMFLGWLLIALLEWASWTRIPHFASGSPPAWHAHQMTLPPPQPLEQVGYPEAEHDDGATWIASPAVRAELAGAWPVALPGEDSDSWVAPADTPADTQPAFVRYARHHVDPTAVATIQVPTRPRRRRLPLSLKDDA